MKYIYTNENCPKCIKQKEEWKKEGVEFIERPSSRIREPEDEIDSEAFINLSLQNNILPVIVDDKDIPCQTC